MEQKYVKQESRQKGCVVLTMKRKRTEVCRYESGLNGQVVSMVLQMVAMPRGVMRDMEEVVELSRDMGTGLDDESAKRESRDGDFEKLVTKSVGRSGG